MPSDGALASLSLESVERLLREEANEAATVAAKPATTAAQTPGIPPPLFGGPAAASPAPVPARAAAPAAAAKPPGAAPRKPSPTGLRLADLVRADGSVDIEGVYRLGRIPDVALSAELLLKALASLPKDVPSSARRAAVRVTATTLVQSVGAGAPHRVVQDALLRRKRLEQFLDGLEAEIAHAAAPLHAEIARLEEQLAAARAGLAAQEGTLEGARRSCGERIAALDEIVTLLHESDAPPPAPVAEDDEEQPPFLREDSVRRLIGLPEEGAVA